MALHLQKLSVGSESLQSLQDWQLSVVENRKARGQTAVHQHVTRMFPKRQNEILDGGSIYWVIKGVIACRNPIVGFEETRTEDGRRACAVLMQPRLIPVVPTAKRPFQGWRYLRADAAPLDLQEIEGAESLPPELRAKLAQIGAW